MLCHFFLELLSVGRNESNLSVWQIKQFRLLATPRCHCRSRQVFEQITALSDVNHNKFNLICLYLFITFSRGLANITVIKPSSVKYYIPRLSIKTAWDAFEEICQSPSDAWWSGKSNLARLVLIRLPSALNRYRFRSAHGKRLFIFKFGKKKKKILRDNHRVSSVEQNTFLSSLNYRLW